MLKSLCNHKLAVIVVTIVIVVAICDQFSYIHTKSKKVPSLHVVALSYNFTSMKALLHVLGISAMKLVPLQLACLKTSGCAEYGTLNTRESDFSSQNKVNTF